MTDHLPTAVNFLPLSAITPASAPCGVCCLGNSMTLDPTVKVLGWEGVLSCHLSLPHFSSCHRGMLCLIHDEPVCYADLAEHPHALFLSSQWWCVCVCVIKCRRRTDRKSFALEPDPSMGTVDPPLIQASPEWMIFEPMNCLNGRKTSKQNMREYMCAFNCPKYPKVLHALRVQSSFYPLSVTSY